MGTRVSEFWQLASGNLQAFVQKYHAEMSEVTSRMLLAANGSEVIEAE